MEGDGQQSAYRRCIAPASSTVSFSKTLSRSVTGSMNDLVHAARWHLVNGTAVHEVGRLLNETPLSALDYQNPREVFNELTGSSESAHTRTP